MKLERMASSTCIGGEPLYSLHVKEHQIYLKLSELGILHDIVESALNCSSITAELYVKTALEECQVEWNNITDTQIRTLKENDSIHSARIDAVIERVVSLEKGRKQDRWVFNDSQSVLDNRIRAINKTLNDHSDEMVFLKRGYGIDGKKLGDLTRVENLLNSQQGLLATQSGLVEKLKGDVNSLKDEQDLLEGGMIAVDEKLARLRSLFKDL